MRKEREKKAVIKYKTRAKKSERKWSQSQCHIQDDSFCADNEVKICSCTYVIFYCCVIFNQR